MRAGTKLCFMGKYVELNFSGRWNPKTLPEPWYFSRRTIQVGLPAKS